MRKITLTERILVTIYQLGALSHLGIELNPSSLGIDLEWKI